MALQPVDGRARSRRGVLTALGTCGVGLAGCTALFDEDPTISLLRVGAINWSDEAVTVEIRIERNGEDVGGETFSFDPGDDGRRLECTWSTDPGAFVVAARLDDGDWERRDLTEVDGECASVYVMIDDPGPSISMPINTDCEPIGGGC